MASWAAGPGRSSGGVVGAIIPPKKKVPEFTLMHYVANNCKYDLDSDASSSEESVGALKAANDRRVNESLQQAREHLMMRDEFPSDDEEDAEGRKKALEMIRKMEYMRNQKDTWKVLGERKSREQDVLSLHPLQRNNDEEYFSGVQKAKSKVRKRNRPSETLVLDEGFFQKPEVSGPQGAPPGVQVPKVRVPSTGLPFKPGPPLPKKSNPWMQRSGADLFSAAQPRSIVAYGVTVQNEEEALALAIAESIRTANEEKNRQLMINLAPPVYNEAIGHGWDTDPPQLKRMPPDPPYTSWDTDDEEKPKGLFCHSVETKEKKPVKSANKTETFEEFSFHSDKPLVFKDDPECVQNMSDYGAKRKKFVSHKDTPWDQESEEKQPQMPLASLQRSKEKDFLSPKQKKAIDDLILHSDASVNFEEAHDMKNASFGKVKSKKEMAHFRPLQNSPQQCSSGSSTQEKSELTNQNPDFTSPEMPAISLPPRQRTRGRSSDGFLTNQKVTHPSSGREENVPAKSTDSNFDVPSTETELILVDDSGVVVQKEVVEKNKLLISSNEKTRCSFEEQQPSGTNPCDLTYKEVEGNTGTSKRTSFFSKEAAQTARPPVTESLEAVKEPKSENAMEPKMFLDGGGNLPSANQDLPRTMLRGSSLLDKPSRLPKSLPFGAGGCSRSSPPIKESCVLETVDSSSPKPSDVSEAHQFFKFETSASTPNQNFVESLVNNNMQGIEAMKLNGSSNNTASLQDILTNMCAPQVTPSLNNQIFGLMAQSAQDKQGIENPTNNVLPPVGQQNPPNFSSQMSQCPPFMTPELMAQIMPQMMFPPVLPSQFTQMLPQMSPDVMNNMAMYQMALQQQYEQQMRQAMACYGLPQMGQTPSEMSPNLNAMQGMLGSSQLMGQPVGPHSLGSLLTPGSFLPSAEMRPGLNISPPAKGRGRLRPSMLQ